MDNDPTNQNMHLNTETNGYCLNSFNNNPKEEYSTVRNGQYWTELHSNLESVHCDVNAYLSEAEMANARVDMVYGDQGHQNENR